MNGLDLSQEIIYYPSRREGQIITPTLSSSSPLERFLINQWRINRGLFTPCPHHKTLAMSDLPMDHIWRGDKLNSVGREASLRPVCNSELPPFSGEKSRRRVTNHNHWSSPFIREHEFRSLLHSARCNQQRDENGDVEERVTTRSWF